VSVVKAASVVEIAEGREAEVRAGSAQRGKGRVESERRAANVPRVHKASVRHGLRESVRRVPREIAHHAAAELGVLSRNNSRSRHNQLRRLQRHRLCPKY
jgi:hypothetical protein